MTVGELKRALEHTTAADSDTIYVRTSGKAERLMCVETLKYSDGNDVFLNGEGYYNN